MTEIPYCKETWAVTAGCTKCEKGCAKCWAIRSAQRLKGKGIRGYDKVVDKNGWTGHIELMPWNLDKPLQDWKKPCRIFVNSMSDLFHPNVSFEFTMKVFQVMRKCPQHTFLIFTKRPEEMYAILPERMFWVGVGEGIKNLTGEMLFRCQLPNVQIILSFSTQKEADEKIPILLQIPAVVRGLSLEPLLGEIDLKFRAIKCGNCGFNGDACYECEDRYYKKRPLGIDWVIVGCESGPKRRSCRIEWIRSIVQQCQAANVPIYVKQIPINGKVSRNPKEWPKDLRIQQYP